MDLRQANKPTQLPALIHGLRQPMSLLFLLWQLVVVLLRLVVTLMVLVAVH
jgi:hypothetical protein